MWNPAKIPGAVYHPSATWEKRLWRGYPKSPAGTVVLDQSLPELNGVSDPAFGTRIDAKSKAMPNIFVITVFDHRAGLPWGINTFTLKSNARS
jgi:hypothetical protein